EMEKHDDNGENEGVKWDDRGGENKEKGDEGGRYGDVKRGGGKGGNGGEGEKDNHGWGKNVGV
ncbi:hypothetical protein, partial [Bacillus velezensis]|uniref:hypothetical protein n=1 Tax=Bacillus velezensis TaxID=492670 RepID=UPI0021B590F8